MSATHAIAKRPTGRGFGMLEAGRSFHAGYRRSTIAAATLSGSVVVPCPEQTLWTNDQTQGRLPQEE